ncbi:hypothetical protein LTR36_000155 [Oleoguttula mirabilis]|uniref:CID domain-containing protein n=1 Tax=Oleoguttula mirabilis TaxID=1507867 RepID=A0AAV9JXR4_9PEZI|nr:hypothetical protein LTR36_000155 [Oleoguttula mirabilis]
MAARSPRGSLSGASDIASDFEDSLKDLQRNDRFAIENLTNIARESTEHAQAISRVLENHIKATAPTRKLPALYVLDSIVKNVGTPYTVYLGRGLYSTFMESYGSNNDPTTRRAMDNLLKTWKEPVPGSMDHRPVFPPDVVRPIESALIRWKTGMLQKQNQPQLQPQGGYRSTATPPQYNGQYAVPPVPVQQNAYNAFGSQQTPQQLAGHAVYHTPTPMQQHYAAPPTSVLHAPIDVQVVKADISSLISRLQTQFAAAPYDTQVQTKLSQILDLQRAVDAKPPFGDSLRQVRDIVAALAAGLPPLPAPTPQPHAPVQWQAPTPTPQWQPPASFPLPYQPQTAASYMQPPPAQSQPLPILTPGALSSLQALLANGQKPSTPQMRTAVPALSSASHTQLNNVQNNVAAAPTANTADLLAALAKSGMFPIMSAPNATPSVPFSASVAAPPASSTASLLQSLQSILPPASQNGTPTMIPAQLVASKPRIPFSAAALKQFRPELVRSLYDEQPNQCSNCGRRFLANDEGRAKKARHLDWHFRTNQRMADPNTGRGQHRSWFVDEMEWIRLTEFDPSTTTADAAIAATTAKKQKGPQDQYVRAPAGVTRNTCSICQEEMRSSYSEELQDWVFMNAAMYNGKIAHATCVEEIKKSSLQSASGAMAAALSGAYAGGRRQRSETPDSALGKRKAEGALAGAGARIKMG